MFVQESPPIPKIASKALREGSYAEPAKPVAPGLSKSSGPDPVFLSLILLVGIGSLFFWLGGGRWSRRRKPADRQREDPILPPEPPPTLLPRSHHESLHDRPYLRRILQAELEGQAVDGARPARAAPQVGPSPEVGSSQGQGSPGNGESDRPSGS
jgi:hypothetical protein